MVNGQSQAKLLQKQNFGVNCWHFNWLFRVGNGWQNRKKSIAMSVQKSLRPFQQPYSISFENTGSQVSSIIVLTVECSFLLRYYLSFHQQNFNFTSVVCSNLVLQR